MNISLRIFTFIALCIISFPRNVYPVAVMSVDLGSEWMKIAIVSPGVPMEIILNTDSQRKTPLVVAFRDGERFIGDSALNVGVRFPEKTFTHFLDLIGKQNLESVSVKKYQERFPYHKLVQVGDKQIGFVLKDNNTETTFTPEELLSMLLKKARHYAEVASAASSSTGKAQTITDCVLTVPPYFSQAQRQSLKHAAFLAGLKVLQLINTNAAFALNYGIFRRKDFNASQPTNILFYDMGAGSTVATIVSYQLVKTKDHGYVETNPQLTIKGVGFDQYLGGFEIQLRLRDHLLKLFAEQNKKKVDDVRGNKRAMSKLLKEAGRLKKVLSANTEYKAQVENVMNDIDFKSVVSRDEFETLAADLLNERVTRPLDDALKSSGYTLDEIDSFIIIGGASRIPKIQQMLQKYLARELSRNVNADEAGALGAAYQAAYLSKGFKVKTFHLKDVNLYKINVDFERSSDNGEKRTVSRLLFGHGNTYPQKKVITFNKHRDDFDFEVNYGEPLPQDSDKSLFKISLKDVNPIFEKYSTNSSVEPKGIKVHFKMDESGILTLDNAEALFEVEYEEILDDNNFEQLSGLVGDAISKFGSKISSLFSGNVESTNETNSDVNATLDSELKDSNTTEPKQSNITLDNSELNSNATNKSNNGEVKKELKKKIVKEDIVSVVDSLGYSLPSADSVTVSQEKLKAIDQEEIKKLKRDQSKNSLESFIHETRDKLYQDEYSNAATEEEKTKIESQLNTVSEWLEYESDGVDHSVFNDRLKSLTDLTKELFNRVREHRERPEAVASLKNMLNISQMFYTNANNMSDEEQIFTTVELTNLRKLIDDTQNWLTESVTEQNALPKNVTPTKLTLRNLAEKMATLDRELKYLLNKARVTPPKKSKDDGNKKDKQEEAKQESDSKKSETKTEKVLENSEEPIDKTVADDDDGTKSVPVNENIDPEVLSDIPPKTEL